MKETYVQFRCSDTQKERITKQAEEREMTVSAYLMWLVREDEERIEKEILKKAKRDKQLEKVRRS